MKKIGKEFSLFQLIDRKMFDALVKKWEMDKWVRELKTWEMTCALISCAMMRLSTYREASAALGIPRSTLGDAMTARCPGFFQELCDQILLAIRARTNDRKVKKAIREILALDSSEISVHGSLFKNPNWLRMSLPKASSDHVAAAKLHVIWNVEGKWVEDYRVTGGRRHDSPAALLFQLQKNKIYVFDRAYCDLTFWMNITNAGSDFVTRVKEVFVKNLKEVKTAVHTNHCGVLYDGVYRPGGKSLRRRKIPRDQRAAIQYRLIVYRDPLTQKTFYFVTSDFRMSATKVASIYKNRWAVELCFRWFKGHLDLRKLALKTTNSIKIQLAIAVLTQLLLQLKKISNQYSGTLSQLLYKIRASLVYQALSTTGAPVGCRWTPAIAGDLEEMII